MSEPSALPAMHRVRVSRRRFIGTAGSVGAGLIISALVPTQSFAKQLLSQTATAPVALAPRSTRIALDASLQMGASGALTPCATKGQSVQRIPTESAERRAAGLTRPFDPQDRL